tara:strand:+ start:696 stop:887 length:192 start_codon:yes stop_codon:yes gene_type:complete
MFFTPISFVCDFQGGGSHLEFFCKKFTPLGIPSEPFYSSGISSQLDKSLVFLNHPSRGGFFTK